MNCFFSALFFCFFMRKRCPTAAERDTGGRSLLLLLLRSREQRVLAFDEGGGSGSEVVLPGDRIGEGGGYQSWARWAAGERRTLDGTEALAF